MINKIYSPVTIKMLLTVVFLLSVFCIYLINTYNTKNNTFPLHKYNKSSCEIEFFFSDQDVILYEVDQQTTVVWGF